MLWELYSEFVRYIVFSIQSISTTCWFCFPPILDVVGSSSPLISIIEEGVISLQTISCSMDEEIELSSSVYLFVCFLKY